MSNYLPLGWRTQSLRDCGDIRHYPHLRITRSKFNGSHYYYISCRKHSNLGRITQKYVKQFHRCKVIYGRIAKSRQAPRSSVYTRKDNQSLSCGFPKSSRPCDSGSSRQSRIDRSLPLSIQQYQRQNDVMQIIYQCVKYCINQFDRNRLLCCFQQSFGESRDMKCKSLRP